MSNDASLSSLLPTLADAPTVGTIEFTVPWQQSEAIALTDSSLICITRALDELPGLVQQLRGSAVQHVSSVRCNIRKIPGLNVTYRAFVGALSDFDDVSSIGNFVEYVRSFPTAQAAYTLSAATNDQTVEIPVIWPVGIGSSVSCTLPPARVPVIVITLETDASTFKGKNLVYQLLGQVRCSGVGHVAGRVGRSGD